jgi:hypothetical protein
MAQKDGLGTWTYVFGGNMNVRLLFAALVLAATPLGLAACSSTYYLVKDVESGREYYTTKVSRSNTGITFKDGKSHSLVTLQNSQVIEITRDQYGADTGTP